MNNSRYKEFTQHEEKNHYKPVRVGNFGVTQLY